MRLNNDGNPSMSADPDASPYYLEAELNSPMCSLRPDESCTMETEWFPTRSGDEFHGVTEAGIVIRALKATAAQNGKINLSGSFGVFYSGKLVARLYDEHGHASAATQVADVRPDTLASLANDVTAPGKCSRVSLHLVDEGGVDRGSLGEVQLSSQDND
jgi:hypothetical protein